MRQVDPRRERSRLVGHGGVGDAHQADRSLHEMAPALVVAGHHRLVDVDEEQVERTSLLGAVGPEVPRVVPLVHEVCHLLGADVQQQRRVVGLTDVAVQDEGPVDVGRLVAVLGQQGAELGEHLGASHPVGARQHVVPLPRRRDQGAAHLLLQTFRLLGVDRLTGGGETAPLVQPTGRGVAHRDPQHHLADPVDPAARARGLDQALRQARATVAVIHPRRDQVAVRRIAIVGRDQRHEAHRLTAGEGQVRGPRSRAAAVLVVRHGERQGVRAAERVGVLLQSPEAHRAQALPVGDGCAADERHAGVAHPGWSPSSIPAMRRATSTRETRSRPSTSARATQAAVSVVPPTSSRSAPPTTWAR